MRVLAGLFMLAVVTATCAVAVRGRRQRQAVADHAASVLRRDWVSELRQP